MTEISDEIKKRMIALESSYEEPYPVQVQGESSYKTNLETICGYYDDEEGYDDDSHKAFLFLDDANKFDPGNAVEVQIDDLTVGYLSKPNAKAYRKRLTELAAPENAIAVCGASIKGGFRKRNSEEIADFGVRLDFELTTFNLVPVRYKDDAPAAPEPIVKPPAPLKSPAPVVIAPSSVNSAADKQSAPKPKVSPAQKGILMILTLLGIFLLCLACIFVVFILPNADRILR